MTYKVTYSIRGIRTLKSILGIIHLFEFSIWENTFTVLRVVQMT